MPNRVKTFPFNAWGYRTRDAGDNFILKINYLPGASTRNYKRGDIDDTWVSFYIASL